MKQNHDLEATTAVCIGAPNNAKRAALFFENIWHLCPTVESAPRVVFPEGFNHDRSLRDRYHEFSYNLAFTHPRFRELFEQAFHVISPYPDDPDQIPGLIAKPNAVLYGMVEETYLENSKGIRDKFLQLVGPLSPIHPIPVLSHAQSFENNNASVADITVTLANLPIVNVTNTSWEQIVEFRKDGESAKALQRMRVFLYETCQDKSRSYIENKINTELDNYHNAVNKHGFDLLTGSLTTLIDSHNIIAASATVVAGALIGGPLVGITSGVALEIGKFAIEVARNRHALRELKRDHPLAYIIKAQEELPQG